MLIINKPKLNLTVVRVNKFNEKSVRKFNKDICKAHTTGQPFIPIIIDSYGGEVYSLLAMVTEISNCKIPVITICESKAMSCGSMLFGMGQERYMSPHATLMIHELYGGVQQSKVEDLKADAEETSRVNRHIFKLLANNCKKKDEYFLDLIHQKGHADWYLDAKEAKKHNLCTSIKIPCLTVELSVVFE